MIRIGGGRLAGRKLLSVRHGALVRPTLQSHRQRLFDWCESGQWLAHGLAGCRVLDAFAGSGSVGLEALSRGASHVWLFERDARVADALRRSVHMLGVENHATVWQGDSMKPPSCHQAGGAVDIVFLDPPYGRRVLFAVTAALWRRGWIDDQRSTIILQTSVDQFDELMAMDNGNSWCLQQRCAGRTVFAAVAVTAFMRLGNLYACGQRNR